MTDPLIAYFTGEEQAGALLVALATVAIGFAIWVWRAHPLFRAA